jgi:hypothetical protein
LWDLPWFLCLLEGNHFSFCVNTIHLQITRRSNVTELRYWGFMKKVQVILLSSVIQFSKRDRLFFYSDIVTCLTLSSPVVTIHTTCFHILKLFILATQCVCAFRVVLTINSSFLPKHQ